MCAADLLLVCARCGACAAPGDSGDGSLADPRTALGPLADCYQTDATLAVQEGDLQPGDRARAPSVDRFEREGLGGSRLHLYVLSNLQRVYLDTDRDGDVLALSHAARRSLRFQSALDSLQHFQILDRRTTSLLVRRGRFAEAETVVAADA